MKKYILFTIGALFITQIYAQYSGGSGTTINPYQIANKNDLQYLCTHPTDWSKHFKQTANITFTSADFLVGGNFYNGGAGFIPIGNTTTHFTGSYDGQGFTIDGLYMLNSSYVGFFGYAIGAEFSNIGLTNVNITGDSCIGSLIGYNYHSCSAIINCYATGADSGNYYVGGLIGWNLYTPLYNCYFSGKIADVTTSYYIAGLVGRNDYSNVDSCYTSGQVIQAYNSSYVGGLIGWNQNSTVYECYANENMMVQDTNSFYAIYSGGLIGQNEYSEIQKCHTSGSLRAARYHGGLVGEDYYGTIQECYSSVDLLGNRHIGGLVGYTWYTTIQYCYATGSISGHRHLGGLVGSNYHSYISNCYATGNITADINYIGGLVGDNNYNDDTIINCYATGNISGSTYGSGLGGLVGANWPSPPIINCYSSGNVTPVTTYSGGLVGTNGSPYQVTNSFWDTQTSGQSSSAGGTGKTTTQMQTQTTFTGAGWSFPTIWTIPGVNQYPALSIGTAPILSPPSLAVSPPNAGVITGGTSTCVGSTLQLGSTGDVGGTWSSSNTSVATITSSGGLVTGIALGTTTIKYLIVTTCGSDSATTTITVTPAPNAGTLSGTQTLCPSDTSNLITNGDAGGSWVSNDTTIATVDNSGVVTGVSLGTDTIEYIVSNSCGSDTAFITVAVTASSSAGTLSGTQILCPSDTSQLVTNGDPGGTWSSSNIGVATVNSSGIVTGVSVGTTTIKYKVTSSCGGDSATITVTVTSSPNAGILSGNQTICTGDTSQLSTNGDPGGIWSSSNASVATVNSSGLVTGVTTGTTTIKYKVSSSCGNDSATISITVSPAVNAGTLSGTQTLCISDTSQLTTNGDLGGIWSSNNLGIATVNGSGIVTAVSVGTTTIKYKVTSSCGSDSSTITVTVTASPDAGILSGNQTICTTDTSQISTSGNPGGTWSSSNASVATVNSSGLVTGIAAGTAIVKYEISSSCGIDSATITVTIITSPNAGTLSGNQIICVGNTTQLVTSGDSTGVWSSSNTGVVTVSSSGLVTGLNSGTAIIKYTVTTSCGSDSATITVTVATAPDAGTISGSHIICIGNTTQLSTNGNSGGIWLSSDTGVAMINSSGFVIGDSIGTTTIIYEVSTSCGVDTATFTVTVDSLPSVIIINPVSPNDTVIINGGVQVDLQAQGTPSGGDYLWQPIDDVACAYCASTSASPTDTTDYIVRYKDKNGCSAYDTITIDVNSHYAVGVPSAFSPNGDGINDILYVRGSEVKTVQFLIYNRYGQKVFESESMDNGWDGTMKGKKLNPGVFVYYVKAVFTNGTIKSLKGNVTLVR